MESISCLKTKYKFLTVTESPEMDFVSMDFILKQKFWSDMAEMLRYNGHVSFELLSSFLKSRGTPIDRSVWRIPRTSLNFEGLSLLRLVNYLYVILGAELDGEAVLSWLYRYKELTDPEVLGQEKASDSFKKKRAKDRRVYLELANCLITFQKEYLEAKYSIGMTDATQEVVNKCQSIVNRVASYHAKFSTVTNQTESLMYILSYITSFAGMIFSPVGGFTIKRAFSFIDLQQLDDSLSKEGGEVHLKDLVYAYLKLKRSQIWDQLTDKMADASAKLLAEFGTSEFGLELSSEGAKSIVATALSLISDDAMSMFKETYAYNNADHLLQQWALCAASSNNHKEVINFLMEKAVLDPEAQVQADSESKFRDLNSSILERCSILGSVLKGMIDEFYERVELSSGLLSTNITIKVLHSKIEISKISVRDRSNHLPFYASLKADRALKEFGPCRTLSFSCLSLSNSGTVYSSAEDEVALEDNSSILEKFAVAKLRRYTLEEVVHSKGESVGTLLYGLRWRLDKPTFWRIPSEYTLPTDSFSQLSSFTETRPSLRLKLPTTYTNENGVVTRDFLNETLVGDGAFRVLLYLTSITSEWSEGSGQNSANKIVEGVLLRLMKQVVVGVSGEAKVPRFSASTLNSIDTLKSKLNAFSVISGFRHRIPRVEAMATVYLSKDIQGKEVCPLCFGHYFADFVIGPNYSIEKALKEGYETEAFFTPYNAELRDKLESNLSSITKAGFSLQELDTIVASKQFSKKQAYVLSSPASDGLCVYLGSVEEPDEGLGLYYVVAPVKDVSIEGVGITFNKTHSVMSASLRETTIFSNKVIERGGLTIVNTDGLSFAVGNSGSQAIFTSEGLAVNFFFDIVCSFIRGYSFDVAKVVDDFIQHVADLGLTQEEVRDPRFRSGVTFAKLGQELLTLNSMGSEERFGAFQWARSSILHSDALPYLASHKISLFPLENARRTLSAQTVLDPVVRSKVVLGQPGMIVSPAIREDIVSVVQKLASESFGLRVHYKLFKSEEASINKGAETDKKN